MIHLRVLFWDGEYCTLSMCWIKTTVLRYLISWFYIILWCEYFYYNFFSFCTIEVFECFAQCSLQGAPLGQQVVALLTGREEGAPQVEHAPCHPRVAAGVLQQVSADGTVRLITPGGGCVWGGESGWGVMTYAVGVTSQGAGKGVAMAPPGGSPLKCSILINES